MILPKRTKKLAISALIISGCFSMGNLFANDLNMGRELLPLKLNLENGLVVTKNAESAEHNQEWYSVFYEKEKFIDDKESMISIIRYLDEKYALDEFDKLVEKKNIISSFRLGVDVEFCGYRVQKLVGMSEDTIFVYLGIKGSYFMILGRLELVDKVMNLENYCHID